MADEQSTQVADDHGQDVTTDTELTDDTQDTEVSNLESDDTSFDDFADDETDGADESDVDEAATESPEDEEAEPDKTVASPDAKTEDTKSSDDPDRQRKNDEAAKKRIADREAKAKSKAEEQEAYIDEATDPTARAQRTIEVEQYNLRVDYNLSKLENAVNASYNSIPEFRSTNAKVQAAMYQAVDDFERMHVQTDRNGDPIKITGDMQTFLLERAAAIRDLAGIGAEQQKSAKANQKSRAVTLPVKTPAKPKADPLLDGFDEEASRW